MNRGLPWSAAIVRALLASAPGLLALAWCAASQSAATAEQAAPVDVGQLDKTAPAAGAGAAPAELPIAAAGEERELTPEEQAQVADAIAKNEQVLTLYGQGRYGDAIPLAEEVLAIRMQVLGEEHPDTATSLNNLGLLLQATGDYAAARPYFEQALAIYRKVLGEEHPFTAAALNNLGFLLQTMGDYAAARPYYEQTLAIKRKVLGEEHPDTATSLNNLGLLLQATGDYAAARPYFEQALAIYRKVLGEEHPFTAAALNNLGFLLQTMGDYAAARPYYEQTLAIKRKVLGEEHPDTATSLNNLGLLLQATGDYAAARPYFEQALAIYRKVLGEEHPFTAAALNNLGSLLQATGDYAAARPYYEQALAIKRKVLGEEHPDTASSLNNLGSLLRATGYDDAARPYFDQALAIVAKLVEATAIAQNETEQLRMSQSLRFYLDSYVSFLIQTRGGDADAYRAVLNWKGATLVRQRAARLVADNEELAPVFAELQSVVGQWSALVAAPPQADPRWKERLDELTRRKAQLEAELSARSAAFRAVTAKVEVEDLQGALPEEAAMVDYFEYWHNAPSPDRPGKLDWRRSIVAFVLRADRGVQMFDLGEATPIAAAIDQWRLGYGLLQESQAAGQELRDKLWAPLTAAIGDAKLVLVSPDGALGKLPFAALPGAKPDGYLIEDVALALVPVPQLIPSLVSGAEKRELPRELLVLGGVDYDSRAAAEITALAAAAAPRRPWDRGTAVDQQAIVAGVSWPYLSGTESEAAYIAGLYQRLMGLPVGSERVVSLRGAEATEEAFRSVAPECYLLHLATHGFFAAEDKESALAAAEPEEGRGGSLYGDRVATVRGYSPGLLSGLVLAGANDPPPLPDDPTQLAAMPDDGILTAEEIAFLPLSGAQLVVLSACESGLGESAGGEGLLGIQRAFQVAGARTTIATLWKVNDEATRRIMEEFYRNYLEREMSPLEALRAAQLWALNNPQLVPRGADDPAGAATTSRLPPQFWAAFTLSGDWR